MAPPLLHTRSGCIAIASHDTKTIYVGGGALTKTGNLTIEKFDHQSGDWSDIGVTLKEEVKSSSSHLVLFNDTDGVTLPVGVPISM